MGYFLCMWMASHAVLLLLRSKPNRLLAFILKFLNLSRDGWTYYGLLRVERNKYINYSELLRLDQSRLVPLNVPVIKSDVALQRQRRPSIAPPNPSDFSFNRHA
jgi:hypothetical protein